MEYLTKMKDNNDFASNKLNEIINNEFIYFLNYKIPNKKNYSLLSKKDNFDIFNNSINIKQKFNYVLDVCEFFKGSKYYKYNALNFVCELFCKYLNFDGIDFELIETETFPDKLCESTQKGITLYLCSLESALEHFPRCETLMSVYIVRIIYELCKYKVFQSYADDIKTFNSNDYTTFSFCMNVIENALDKKDIKEEKSYLTKINIILKMAEVFDTFMAKNISLLSCKQKKYFMTSFLVFISAKLGKFLRVTHTEDLYDLEKEKSLIENFYKKFDIKNDYLKQLKSNLNDINMQGVQEVASKNLDTIKNYYKKYANLHFTHKTPYLQDNQIQIINQTICEYGYDCISILIDALYYKNCEAIPTYEYLLNRYIQKSNNKKVIDLIEKE